MVRTAREEWRVAGAATPRRRPVDADGGRGAPAQRCADSLLQPQTANCCSGGHTRLHAVACVSHCGLLGVPVEWE
jgi:hypothetical protein